MVKSNGKSKVKSKKVDASKDLDSYIMKLATLRGKLVNAQGPLLIEKGRLEKEWVTEKNAALYRLMPDLMPDTVANLKKTFPGWYTANQSELSSIERLTLIQWLFFSKRDAEKVRNKNRGMKLETMRHRLSNYIDRNRTAETTLEIIRQRVVENSSKIKSSQSKIAQVDDQLEAMRKLKSQGNISPETKAAIERSNSRIDSTRTDDHYDDTVFVPTIVIEREYHHYDEPSTRYRDDTWGTSSRRRRDDDDDDFGYAPSRRYSDPAPSRREEPRYETSNDRGGGFETQQVEQEDRGGGFETTMNDDRGGGFETSDSRGDIS